MNKKGIVPLVLIFILALLIMAAVFFADAAEECSVVNGESCDEITGDFTQVFSSSDLEPCLGEDIISIHRCRLDSATLKRHCESPNMKIREFQELCRMKLEANVNIDESYCEKIPVNAKLDSQFNDPQVLASYDPEDTSTRIVLGDGYAPDQLRDICFLHVRNCDKVQHREIKALQC